MKQKFTLIELLVVIAIIAILAAMLLPTLNVARSTAKRVQCMGVIKGSGMYLQMYVNDFETYYATNYIKDWKPQYCSLTNAAHGNQRYAICNLGLYTQNRKNFLDPASFSKDLTNICSGNNQYGVPKVVADIRASAVKNPTKKIFSFCSSRAINDAFQGVQIRTDIADFFPGTIHVGNLKAKMAVITNNNVAKDFANRHGNAVNAVFLDGHAESIVDKDIVAIGTEGAAPAYGGTNSGAFYWDKN